MHRINLQFTKNIRSENEVIVKGLFTDQKLDSFYNPPHISSGFTQASNSFAVRYPKLILSSLRVVPFS